MLNLDTHVLIFALRGELRVHERILLARERWFRFRHRVLGDGEAPAAWTHRRWNLEDPEVAGVLNRIHVWPIDLAVAIASTRLDFKGDPADELIAATSVVHRIPLMTRDLVIRGSGIVPLA